MQPPKAQYQVHQRWQNDPQIFWLAHLWLRTHDVPVIILSERTLTRALQTGIGQLESTPHYDRLVPTPYGENVLYTN